MIAAILFDKDGTLFDFRATWSDFAASFFLELAAGDECWADAIAAAVGFDFADRRFHEDSPLIAGTPGDIAKAILPHVPGSTPAALVARMNALSATVPQHEAAPLKPLLSDLRKRGLRLGVVTNDAMSPAKAHLRQAGVLHLLERVIGCDCGFGQKPEPGQIQAFTEIVGVEPSQTLVVGDSVGDLIAARRAGCPSVGVLTGVASERQLAPLAAAVLSSIADLPALLDELDTPGRRTDAA